MGGESDWDEKRVEKIENKIDSLEDNNLIEALKYLALQGNDEPITRDQLFNVLMRFKLI